MTAGSGEKGGEEWGRVRRQEKLKERWINSKGGDGREKGGGGGGGGEKRHRERTRLVASLTCMRHFTLSPGVMTTVVKTPANIPALKCCARLQAKGIQSSYH